MESHIQRANAETGVAMKPVVQRERTGCGIASVAVLAGVSYRQAQGVANRLGIFAGDSRLWSETRHVRRLLKEYGVRPAHTEVPFTSWEALMDRAVLAVKWHTKRERAFWHCGVLARASRAGCARLEARATSSCAYRLRSHQAEMVHSYSRMLKNGTG
ncbi:MAG: hypothetical protein SGJ26_19500 [Nitrospirota bacterium]|nr:hypothetical protein [Nitrospirota bacterium]